MCKKKLYINYRTIKRCHLTTVKDDRKQTMRANSFTFTYGKVINNESINQDLKKRQQKSSYDSNFMASRN